MFILGDFNYCSLNKFLPVLFQHAKRSTRNSNILDKCYGNIKDAYSARARPPLGNSDHKVIHLLPVYWSIFKLNKPVLHQVNVWSQEKMEESNSCFRSTNWEMFFSDANLNCVTEAVTAYITFCVDSIIPQKTVKGKKITNNI